MSVLDNYVNEWNQKRMIIRVIVIDFVILLTFLITTIFLFYPSDLWTIFFGMIFLGFVFEVPMLFWGDKRKYFIISNQEFLTLSNEEETEEPKPISKQRKIGITILTLFNCFFVFIWPIYYMPYLAESYGNQLDFILASIILYWAFMILSGFGITYESDSGRSFRLGRDVPIAAQIIKSIETKEEIEDTNVRILVITNMGERTVFFLDFLFVIPSISDEALEFSMERFYGEGTSLELTIKESLVLEQMEEAEEYDIGLDYTVGFYLHVGKKDFRVNVWYPRNEAIKKVDELSPDGYDKLLELLFQKVDEIRAVLPQSHSL